MIGFPGLLAVYSVSSFPFLVGVAAVADPGVILPFALNKWHKVISSLKPSSLTLNCKILHAASLLGEVGAFFFSLVALHVPRTKTDNTRCAGAET